MPRGAPGKLKEATRAFLYRIPTAKELEGSGLTPEDYEPDPVDVWPEHWPAFDVFDVVSTQWRVGMSGRTGLDYNVLFRVLDDRYEDKAEWQSVFDDLRVIENEALTVWSEPK